VMKRARRWMREFLDEGSWARIRMFVLIVFRQIIDWVDSLPEPPLELVLPDELQDSLRLLKPEGNLLKDRFRNILMRGKMETRKPIQQPKKKRRTYTEKWTYKDFVAPS